MAANGTTPTENRWNKGNSYDHRKRIENILWWWGDGITTECVWCHRILCNNPGDGSGVAEADHVSVDHIVCHADGGRYTMKNLVPSCQTCNKSRGRKSFTEWATLKGADAARLTAHAAGYKPRRKRKG